MPIDFWYARREPAVRDVRVDVVVEQHASDAVLQQGIRLVLDTDERIEGRRIDVLVRDQLVVLSGTRLAPGAAAIAEEDAWSAGGAHDVFSAIAERRLRPRAILEALRA